MNKITVNGKVTWESDNGERLQTPDDPPKDYFGYQKVTIDGVTMWESPDGLNRVSKLK
jgi:hypothetical protein